jgi:hypothetical protein
MATIYIFQATTRGREEILVYFNDSPHNVPAFRYDRDSFSRLMEDLKLFLDEYDVVSEVPDSLSGNGYYPISWLLEKTLPRQEQKQKMTA